jgi:hypothetical protein
MRGNNRGGIDKYREIPSNVSPNYTGASFCMGMSVLAGFSSPLVPKIVKHADARNINTKMIRRGLRFLFFLSNWRAKRRRLACLRSRPAPGPR